MEKITIGQMAPVVEIVEEVSLIAYWHENLLTGNHWRCYLNSDNGSGIFWNGKKYELEKDRFYILPPNCNLPVWCDNPAIMQFYIHFRLDYFHWNLSEPFGMIKGYPFLLEVKKRAMMAKENSLRRLLSAGAVVASVLSLLPEQALSVAEPDMRIEYVIEEMKKNLATTQSLTQLAAKVALSPNQFIRRFRAKTGTTPYQYLTNLRYATAAKLLQQGKLTIDEITLAIGVNDRSLFSRTFRQFYGLPPVAYRKHVSQS